MDKSKQPKCGKSKAWMFTLNNPEDDQAPAGWPDVKYCKWQKEEAPTTGTPHLQGPETDKRLSLILTTA